MNLLNRTFLTLAVAMPLIVCNQVRAAGSGVTVGLEVGNLFPTIQLPTLDGQIKSIENFRGRKIILHVFASW